MSDVCDVAHTSLLGNDALITHATIASDASKIKIASIAIKISLSIIAPLARARIFDAVVSAALTLKTLTLTDCNRR